MLNVFSLWYLKEEPITELMPTETLQLYVLNKNLFPFKCNWYVII